MMIHSNPRNVIGCAATLLCAALSLGGFSSLNAQDNNVLFPVDTIENRLRHADFKILTSQGTRWEGDRTDRVVLAFPDKSVMMVKWAMAGRGADEFNNRPRYELAAYEIQKLFLDPGEYAVPPTVGRCFPLGWYRLMDQDVQPTFDDGQFILVLLQYWLYNVTPEDFYSRGRLEDDENYARHLANFNILTYLIRHNDSNVGNFLVSTDPANPRVFSVDNGVAFTSEVSDRGYVWRNIRVDKLPRKTVDRLRDIELEDLHEALGVIAQFEMRNGTMAPAEPGTNLDPEDGVRYADDVLQLGLTRAEIEGVHERLQKLLREVDEGKIQLF